MIAYTVIFQIHPDHTTTVVQTSANLKLRRKVSAAGDFAPVFPGATGQVLRSTAESLRSMSYSTPASPEEIKKFYREALGKAGYDEAQPGIFQKDGESIRLLVIKSAASSTVTLMASTVGPVASPR
jgi:hypothetical protein